MWYYLIATNGKSHNHPVNQGGQKITAKCTKAKGKPNCPKKEQSVTAAKRKCTTAPKKKMCKNEKAEKKEQRATAGKSN